LSSTNANQIVLDIPARDLNPHLSVWSFVELASAQVRLSVFKT